MDQNLSNFWKNYEDIINWGYTITGARRVDCSESTAPINLDKKVCFFQFSVKVHDMYMNFIILLFFLLI